jgi:hypothetical protein
MFIAEIPTSLYKLIKKPIQHRLEMNGIGNGVVVAIEAL